MAAMDGVSSHFDFTVTSETLKSSMIAAFGADVTNTALKDGYTLPRGAQLRSRPLEGESTPCEFRTAADVTLWPIEIAEAEYIDGRGELVAAGVTGGRDARANAPDHRQVRLADQSRTAPKAVWKAL